MSMYFIASFIAAAIVLTAAEESRKLVLVFAWIEIQIEAHKGGQLKLESDRLRLKPLYDI